MRCILSCSRSVRFERSVSRRGLSLVEMLVALTVTMIMMGAVITVFGFIGDRISGSRAMIETNDRLRSSTNRLREDLATLTCDATPWQRPEMANGFIEIIEGPVTERAILNSGTDTITGDCDDILMFTIRSRGRPFVSRTGRESSVAEVIWYARPSEMTTNPPTFTLCRRQLLVDPTFTGTGNQQDDDISRSPASGKANSLGDLTMRENRYMHQPGTFPFPVAFVPVTSATGIRAPLTGSSNQRIGEEVILTNVLSFDVKVFDPMAPMKTASNGATTIGLTPSDPGYASATAASGITGEYVDMGDPASPRFSSMQAKSGLTGQPFTYDTWSFHYEHDGIQQGTGTMDPVTNDAIERETSPPFPFPLRGIKVTIRIYEPSSKQVREQTVVESFVPE
ncbi:MAG: prepilin-type N-terminal cleavage/methylation domain-containing protein [Planctomycetota bacterium]|nr:prepilin-type N-terminal cleavage/methylation domain-containing protein [Planctomycetota bacterium]